jgi:hypothetical protein
MFTGVHRDEAEEAVEHILLYEGHAHGHGDLHGAGEMGNNDTHHHHLGDERPEMCVAFG